MIALKSSYLGVSKFINEHQGDSSIWFDMTFDERFEEIRTWKNKTVMDLSKELYEALGRVIPNEDDTSPPKDSDDKRKAGRPKRSSSSQPATKHHDEKRHVSGSKTEKPVADWNEEELLKLAEALGELLEGRRTRRYLFEEEKDRFYRRYEDLGGNNPVGVAISRARYLMDSYEFIYAYNEKAEATNSLSWFELAPADRGAIAKKVSRLHRNFNGLGTVDAELFDAVDEVDAVLRQKLNETKRKTYKPPTDTASGSSRYVDPESLVEIFQRLQQQRDAEKAKDEELMHQLFGRSERA
ncbi:hypothetical protein BBO99_00007525 [Phytophthora kernoviae]|uniref:Uncharacterized protein n=2 Tax=Phytophthora kernoviae TaxID=325452 RepID=A0A3R7KRA8_9STRA|nr:hypothetical protein G195_008419 [Phytophthora kernoviae 00238/432]KAG2519414.1 hypothetical protein JM16_007149 [Phytophthora kernoviae]KAG2520526.1 hypothetical protein JM18_007060 [Phytophthora kernoviae]RLN21087.1 hypothetical protein BBI17_007845 [Phytophthora kernoviae]RLN76477.1 hypothetical protein BBO99_00007525 [Phytophthora kernoviae]